MARIPCAPPRTRALDAVWTRTGAAAAPVARILALLALAWPGLACDAEPELRYVDPPVKLAAVHGVEPVAGDPAVEIGFYAGQVFAPLAEGGDLPVIHGLQGGTWTMPAMRLTGIGSPATVMCLVTTDGGEAVGRANALARFFASPGGALEIQFFPIEIRHAAPAETSPIDDLYGQKATLDCTVTDRQGRTGRITRSVTLVAG